MKRTVHGFAWVSRGGMMHASLFPITEKSMRRQGVPFLPGRCVRAKIIFNDGRKRVTRRKV